MLQQLSIDLVFHLMLIFTRIGGMLSFMPGMGELYFPVRVRLIFALSTSIMVYPVLISSLPANLPAALSDLITILFIEFLVGILIGLTAKIYLLALDVVGNIIAMNAGLSAASFFNPSQRMQQPVTSILLTLFATAAILATDSHHYYFLGFMDSYQKFPIGGYILTGDISNHITQIVNSSFITAFKIASPFIVVNFAIQVGAGILARLMPALQVFFIILPAQITAMFAVMLVTIPFINNKISLQLIENLQTLIFP